MSIFFLITILAAYFIGSFSSSLVLCCWLNKNDVRQLGSGNAGATNMARNYGNAIGAVVFITDCCKTVLALFIGQMLGIKGVLLALVGLATVVGHCYPIFHQFKGGKGVSVALTCLLMMAPFSALITISVFAIIFWITRTVSIASLGATILAPLSCCLLGYFKLGGVFILYVALIIWQHRDNIKRLRHNQEKPLVTG
jgi:acyl phosphate:glycerol-3-phosphate acyltransferase